MTEIEKQNEIQINNFMNNIVGLREKHNLTKKQMAEICGISLYSLRKIEKGELPNVSCEIVINLARYFNISASDLFLDNL